MASLIVGSVRALTAELGVSVLPNGNFEAGAANWVFSPTGSGSFSTVTGYQGQPVRLVIARKGKDALSQYDVPVEPGASYRISFSGRSNTGHDLRVLLQKRDAPSTNYGLSERVNLTSSWQTFAIDFTAKNLTTSVSDGQVSFSLGRFDAAGDEYWLDSVVLQNLALQPPSPPRPSDRIRIQFSPSAKDFRNPERGFMKQVSIFVDQPLDPSKIRALQPSDSLVWVYFRLDNYRDPRDGVAVTLANYHGRPIDEAGLATIQSTFATARAKGLKLVIRFVYNFGPGSTTDPNLANPDAPIDLVLEHIAQLKPLLIANTDVIAAMQAGFVGHWGEWHSSKYLHEYRRPIVDALLAALPKQRMLQLRYPRYKEIFYQGPLTATKAFSGADASRVGHCNDCFLSDADDGGTYRSKSSEQPQYASSYCAGATDEIACWKGFVAQEGRFTPVGGETCQVNGPRSACQNALQELEILHWSFLHNGYKKEVLDSWRATRCMAGIRRRLGYRFALKEALVPSVVARGGTLDLDVSLRNKGFAAPYNLRPVLAVLYNRANRYDFQLNSVDPRRWEPGSDYTFGVQVKLPGKIAPGTYALAIWLPDEASTLHDRPVYSVRFANKNVWNASLGLNILTLNLHVE